MVGYNSNDLYWFIEKWYKDPESAYIGLVFTTGFLIGGVYNNIVSGIA